VIAELDEGSYPIGIKISDRQMKDLPISRDDWHGDWNYTLHPTRDTPETRLRPLEWCNSWPVILETSVGHQDVRATA